MKPPEKPGRFILLRVTFALESGPIPCRSCPDVATQVAQILNRTPITPTLRFLSDLFKKRGNRERKHLGSRRAAVHHST